MAKTDDWASFFWASGQPITSPFKACRGTTMESLKEIESVLSCQVHRLTKWKIFKSCMKYLGNRRMKCQSHHWNVLHDRFYTWIWFLRIGCSASIYGSQVYSSVVIVSRENWHMHFSYSFSFIWDRWFICFAQIHKGYFTFLATFPLFA